MQQCTGGSGSNTFELERAEKWVGRVAPGAHFRHAFDEASASIRTMAEDM